jgi:carbonic anhydrase
MPTPVPPIIGTQQSPIEIDKDASWRPELPREYLNPNYTGNVLAGEFLLEKHNFEFRETEYFTITGPDGHEIQDWVIRRIHFHDRAEHRVKGRARARYEAHIVHTMGTSPADDPNLAGPKLVLATFFHHDQKAPSRASAKRLNDLLKEARESRRSGKIEAGVNPLDFLPHRSDWPYWYRYEGSLTSEPYSEDVTWFVYDRETGVQDDDFKFLAGRAEQTARDVLSVNRRYILRSFE